MIFEDTSETIKILILIIPNEFWPATLTIYMQKMDGYAKNYDLAFFKFLMINKNNKIININKFSIFNFVKNVRQNFFCYKINVQRSIFAIN
jgi:hypothetical protein